MGEAVIEVVDEMGFSWLRQGQTLRPPRTGSLKTKSGTAICYSTGSGNTSRMTIEDRFRTSIRRVSNGCWLWTGSVDPDGYARFFLGRVNGKTKMVFAHRWAYQHFVGTIPDGQVIDHIAEVCGHRNCVNPKHLQAVPAPTRRAAGRTTFCRYNHNKDEVGRRPDGTCAECARDRVREYRAKRRSSAEYRAKRAAYERERRRLRRLSA